MKSSVWLSALLTFLAFLVLARIALAQEAVIPSDSGVHTINPVLDG